MTTTLTDKQLADAYDAGLCDPNLPDDPALWVAAGLRAVADLAITQAESEIHALKAELALSQKPDK